MWILIGKERTYLYLKRTQIYIRLRLVTPYGSLWWASLYFSVVPENSIAFHYFPIRYDWAVGKQSVENVWAPTYKISGVFGVKYFGS